MDALDRKSSVKFSTGPPGLFRQPHLNPSPLLSAALIFPTSLSPLSLPLPAATAAPPPSASRCPPSSLSLLSPPFPPFPFFPALPLSYHRRRACARPPSPPADPTPPPSASSSDISPGIRHHLHPQTPRRHPFPADTTTSAFPHRSRYQIPSLPQLTPSPVAPTPPTSPFSPFPPIYAFG
ncbi:hypothetical protein Droror1_Dr00012979 [Drosera rotundifolia]